MIDGRERASSAPLELSASKLDLDTERERQIADKLRIGLHSALHVSPEDYARSFPRFRQRPESFLGRFDIPLVVDPRIPALLQLQMAVDAGLFPDYEDGIGGLQLSDWVGAGGRFETPGSPYVTWADGGRLYKRRTVRDVRESLRFDERGGTIHDGITLAIHYAGLVRGRGIDFPGTSVGSIMAPNAPFLDMRGQKPDVCFDIDSSIALGFGPMVCGLENN